LIRCAYITIPPRPFSALEAPIDATVGTATTTTNGFDARAYVFIRDAVPKFASIVQKRLRLLSAMVEESMCSPRHSPGGKGDGVAPLLLSAHGSTLASRHPYRDRHTLRPTLGRRRNIGRMTWGWLLWGGRERDPCAAPPASRNEPCGDRVSHLRRADTTRKGCQL
jgi:hypothetical protein